MDNKRGLFLTEVVSKVYEKVLKNRNSLKINTYTSDYQSGGVRGKSSGDNVFVLSEIIRMNKKLNRKTCWIYYVYTIYGSRYSVFGNVR